MLQQLIVCRLCQLEFFVASLNTFLNYYHSHLINNLYSFSIHPSTFLLVYAFFSLNSYVNINLYSATMIS